MAFVRALRRRLPLLPFFLAYSAGIFIAAQISPSSIQSETDAFFLGKPQVYEALVSSYPERNARGGRFQVTFLGLLRGDALRPFQGRGQMSLLGTELPEKGERIRFRATLRHSRNFGNDREWNFERYCRNRGIDYVGSIAGDGRWVQIEKARGIIQPFFNRLRARALWRASVYSDFPNDGLYRSLVLGELGGVDQTLIESFRRAGVLHLLVVSGSHVGLVAILFGFLAGFLLRRSAYFTERLPIWHVRLVGGLVGIFLLCALLDLPIPTLRALIGALLISGALFLHRPRDGWAILLLTAILLVLIHPGYLFDVSFQLSFLAVGGILAGLSCFPRTNSPQNLQEKIVYGMRTLLVASSGAFVATLPVILYHFSRISVWSLVGNVLFVPAIGGVAIPIGLAATYVPGWMSGFLFSCFDRWLGFWIPLLERFAQLPGSDVWIPRPHPLALVGFTLLAALFWLWRAKQIDANRKMFTFTFAATSMMIAPFFFPKEEVPQIHFIHVGQGDATFIKTTHGRTILIDAGPGGERSFDAGERILVPWLRVHGYDRIDLLVLTHGDSDHVGGGLSIAKRLEIGEIWYPPQFLPPIVRDLKSFAEQKEIEWKTIDSTSPPWRIDDVRLFALHPSPNTRLESDNNRGLVLGVEFPGYRALMTADVESDAEKEILSRQKNLHFDLLKVPHHGSRTSSSEAFLKAVKPTNVVFLVGWKNRYGHPHREVLERYLRSHARSWRGDECGEIVVRIRPNGAELNTIRPCHDSL